jgi:hypothetical protein
MTTDGRTRGPEAHFVGTWEAAEINAARWMRHWGYTDALASPGGPDGGIDVRATGAFAQVKNRSSQVGRSDVQRLVGATVDHPGAQLFFFSAGGFSARAVEEADKRGIALFTFVLDGTMTAVNASATRVAQAARAAGGGQARPSGTPDRSALAQWAVRNWRAIGGVMCLLAPFGSLSDAQIYTGPFLLDAVKFVGLLVCLWLVGLALIGWDLQRRQRSDAGAPTPVAADSSGRTLGATDGAAITSRTSAERRPGSDVAPAA